MYVTSCFYMELNLTKVIASYSSTQGGDGPTVIEGPSGEWIEGEGLLDGETFYTGEELEYLGTGKEKPAWNPVGI